MGVPCMFAIIGYRYMYDGKRKVVTRLYRHGLIMVIFDDPAAHSLC